MKLAAPSNVKCPACAVESQHRAQDLLALTALCPACGSSFDEIGRSMGASLDEWHAFVMWAEVLSGVEHRLGLPKPGIQDDEVLQSKRAAELNLRDVVRTVIGHLPDGVDAIETASRLVLESAEQVAECPLSPADMDLPLLQALRVAHWAQKHGRMT